MANVKDLFQIIAGKEVMLFDLSEELKKCKEENSNLTAKLELTGDKQKGNGKHADKPVTVKPAKSTGG